MGEVPCPHIKTFNFFFIPQKIFVNAATLLAIKEHESSPDTKPL